MGFQEKQEILRKQETLGNVGNLLEKIGFYKNKQETLGKVGSQKTWKSREFLGKIGNIKEVGILGKVGNLVGKLGNFIINRKLWKKSRQQFRKFNYMLPNQGTTFPNFLV